MKLLRKFGLLLLVASFTLNSCASSTDPSSNNSGGDGNTGQFKVGNTYTSDVYITDADFNPTSSPQTATSRVESINSTWMGRTNVIVTSSPEQPGQKGYHVVESNGDVSIYAAMVGGPQGVIISRWIRIPASGTGETTIDIDTTVTMNTLTTRITGQWRIRPTGTGTTEAAGKTWNVQKIALDQNITWEIFGSQFDMRIHTDYHFSKELMLAVRSNITTTQSAGGFEQSAYQSVVLKSYQLK